MLLILCVEFSGCFLFVPEKEGDCFGQTDELISDCLSDFVFQLFSTMGCDWRGAQEKSL
jgi:hypothetical protein